MFDKKARQVAMMVAADWCDFDWFWATVHAPTRDAALDAIFGRDWRERLTACAFLAQQADIECTERARNPRGTDHKE
jgi:hypothetical protein